MKRAIHYVQDTQRDQCELDFGSSSRAGACVNLAVGFRRARASVANEALELRAATTLLSLAFACLALHGPRAAYQDRV